MSVIITETRLMNLLIIYLVQIPKKVVVAIIKPDAVKEGLVQQIIDEVCFHYSMICQFVRKLPFPFNNKLLAM